MMQSLRSATFVAVLASISVLALTPPVWALPGDDDYAVATGHYSEKRWAESAAQFQAFLAKYPRHAKANVARFYLGEALVQARRYGEARLYFDAFHEANPDHKFAAQALFRRGEAAFFSGDSPTGRKHLEAFQQQHKEHAFNAYALPYLGEILLDAGVPDQAQVVYAESINRFPNGPMVEQSRFGSAKAMQAQGQLAEAAARFKEIADNPASRMADEALLQLGHTQFQLGQYAAAEATLATLPERFTNSRMKPYAYYWQGLALRAQLKWDQAATALELASSVRRQHPLAPAATYHWADSLRQAGKLGLAAEGFRGVEHNWPQSAWSDDAGRGRIRTALAAREHRTVAELAPRFAQTYRRSPLRYDVQQLAARSLLQQEQYEAAEQSLKPLVEALDAVDLAAADEVTRPTLPNPTELAELRQTTRYYLALAQVGLEQFESAVATVAPIRVDPAKSPQLAAGVAVVHASAAIGAGNYAAAVAPLREHLRLDPGGPDAAKRRAQLAVALTETGQWPAAQQAFADYASNHSADAQLLPTMHYIAEKAMAAGQKEWAAQLFTSLAAEGNPEDYRAKGLSGLAWLKNDPAAEDGEAAFEQLRKAHAGSPLVSQAALARGMTLEKAGDTVGALKKYQLIFDEYAKSKEYPYALKQAAAIHEAERRPAEAARLAAQYVREFPEAEDLDKVLYLWAWSQMAQQRHPDAQAAFTRIYLEFPQSTYWPDATYRLADMAAAAENAARVDELVGKIAETAPNNPVTAHALYLQGQTAARGSRWDQVATPMQALVTNFPAHPLKLSAGYWIAESLYRQQKLDEAATAFADVSKAAQGRKEAWLGMIDLRRAQILALQKEWEESQTLAATIATNFPDFPQQYEADYLIGRCLAMQAQFTKARQAYEKVLAAEAAARTETAAKAQWMIGESYFHQKNYDAAIQAYSRVEILYAYPEWQAASLLQAGKCFEEKNAWSDAADRYAKLIQQFGQTRYKEEASTRLTNARRNAQRQSQQGAIRDDASNRR